MCELLLIIYDLIIRDDAVTQFMIILPALAMYSLSDLVDIWIQSYIVTS